MMCFQDICHGMKRSYEQAFQSSIIPFHETSVQLGIFETTGLPEDIWKEIIDQAYEPMELLLTTSYIYTDFQAANNKFNQFLKMFAKLRAINRSLNKFFLLNKLLLAKKTGQEDPNFSKSLNKWLIDGYLQRMVRRNNHGWVQLLLQLGADVHVKECGKNTLLHQVAAGWYASYTKPEIIKLLVCAGAQVNAKNTQGFTPLHLAAGYGAPEVVEVLVQAGADVNIMGPTGRTPLHLAAYKGRLNTSYQVDVDGKAIKLLVQAGAQVDVRDKAEDTPLHLAARDCHNPKNIELLVQAGAKINARDPLGNTPLHLAARGWYGTLGFRRPQVVKQLLVAGAHREAKNIDGKTPLDVAADEEIAQLIREYKKD